MAVQTAPQSENRWQTIKDLWANNQWLFVVVGYVIGLLTFPALEEVITNLTGLLSGFVPETVGIGFTVIFIDRLNQQREERRRINDLQERLVRDAGSPIQDIVVQAVRKLNAHNWLTGNNGLLQSADLVGANLSGVGLQSANLSGADLVGAKLSGANLYKSNLSDANLWGVNLSGMFLHSINFSGVFLHSANLSGADLVRSNLSSADLRFANLSSADLRFANLSGANLQKAQFDVKTVLPDASHDFKTNTYDKYWTPDTDMTRYTNPDHPDFWQPDWVKEQQENEKG